MTKECEHTEFREKAAARAPLGLDARLTVVTTDRVVEGPSEELLVWRSERGLKLSSAAGAAEVGVWVLGGHAWQLATRPVTNPKDDNARKLGVDLDASWGECAGSEDDERSTVDCSRDSHGSVGLLLWGWGCESVLGGQKSGGQND